MKTNQHLLSTISAAMLSLSLSGTASAALLVYENYGSLTSGGNPLGNGVTLNGAVTGATGFSGNSYSVANSNSGSSVYSGTGLTFSNLSTSGGAALLTASSVGAVSGGSTTGIAITASMPIGSTTLWSSYLVNFNSLSSVASSVAAQRINSTATGTSSNSRFGSSAESGAAQRPGIAYNNTSTNFTGGSALSTGQTYLVVSSYTNVGQSLSGGAPGVASLWMFTETNYNNWLATGDPVADLLSGGYASYSISAPGITTGTFSFSQFSQFAIFAGGGASSTQAALFDELRYGTTLGDVVAVPEPSSCILLGAAGLLFVARRGRR